MALKTRGRVLHVLKYYRPGFTGEGVFLERCSNLMQALAPEVGHDLLVTATPRPDVPPANGSTIDNVFYLTTGGLGAWRHEFLLLWWFVCNLHRYDTVHVRTHADWYFLTYLLSKLRGKKLILSATLDDSVPVLIGYYRKRLRPIARWVFRLFDGHVAISPKLLAESSSAVRPITCHLIPCGIDFPALNPERGQDVRTMLGIPGGAMVLIFVGGLCERKDPMLLVSHMPELLRQRPDCYLLLVGPELEPRYVEDMRSFIQANGLERHVIFVGEVQDPHPWFDAADIMTFASRLEGFGTVVPEAMAHALPVVVRHLPGVNDMFVKDGETGFFFTDGAGYVAAVQRLIGDKALRAETGARARILVARDFDMRQVAAKYLALYGFTCDEAPPSSAATPAAAWADLITIGNTASIINPRFHLEPPFPRTPRPMLVTTIDAEEAFDWGKPFSRGETDVSSMAHQGPAHRIFERHGVVPTYLVDYPVVAQDEGRAPLLDYLRDGCCDIGTQLHPWVTPPYLETVSNRNSYPGNLPLTLEFEKIRALTNAIEDAFGERPRIYRAGRYGAGTRTGDILKRLGYEADTSEMPAWDFGAHEGPDFSALSARPHWIDSDRSILEIPCSAAVVGRLAEWPRLRRAVLSDRAERLGIPSLTAHLGLIERIRLTPEGITVTEAKRLVRHMLAQGHKVFVLTYHTPSLVPGNTPYVRGKADLDRFLGWLDEFYSFFADEVGGVCATWRDVRAAALDQVPIITRRKERVQALN